MTYEPPPHLWIPQRRGLDETIDHIDAGRSACLFAPTGGGKTVVACELLKWAESRGQGGIFFVNRKLLVGQTFKSFEDSGLKPGVRAADYEDKFWPDRSVQISSADTERARVYKSGKWKLHPADLVIVDEAHIQKGATMKRLLSDYRMMGANIVLLTATPVGISESVDELVVSGSLKEYRECKAIVPARVFSVQNPDLRKVKRNCVGEFLMDGKKKKMYVQHIVDSVVERYKRHNPEQLPTMLYAPGKPESVFLTEQFEKAGISWCHIDATDAVFGGQRLRLTRELWQDLLGMYRDGTIRGFSSRFKLREGIDEPSTGMCILATPIGSLASYIQTVGRVLRYSKQTPEEVVITDHGGNYLRHGSPNADRDWSYIWGLPERVINKRRENAMAEGELKEPIRCPECGGERVTGIHCPHCGNTSGKSMRQVMMEDGSLEDKEGGIVPRKRFVVKPDTQKRWTGMYWAFRNNDLKKSFAQMRGYFHHEHGYCPPKTLDHMPITEAGWYTRVSLVPNDSIRWPPR